MGNPAMVRRKNTEKRRKKFEARLGPGAYLPKDEREALNAELKKAAEDQKDVQAKAAVTRKEKAKAKEAAKKS